MFHARGMFHTTECQAQDINWGKSAWSQQSLLRDRLGIGQWGDDVHHLCFMGLLIPLFLLSSAIIIIVIIGIGLIIIFYFVSVIEMFFSQPKSSHFFLLLNSIRVVGVWE